MTFLELFLLFAVIVAVLVGTLNKRTKRKFDVREKARKARLVAISENKKAALKSKPVPLTQQSFQKPPSPGERSPNVSPKPTPSTQQSFQKLPSSGERSPGVTPKPVAPIQQSLQKLPSASVSWQVKSKAYSLMDEKTLNRMLTTYRHKHPGQTEQWLWEKMVWDLERDRFR